MNRLFCFLCLAAIAAALGSSAGCNRQHYRLKADREVYSVLKQGTNDPRWQIDDYHLTPDSTSRMFVPYSPDKEPMPPDDPAAHRKMHRVAGMKGSPYWYEHGVTQTVENPRWRQFLLLNEKGEVPLDKDQAITLARLHSSEYQEHLENLYAAAMRVSQARFRYDVQFFGDGSLTYTDPSSGTQRLTNRAEAGAQRRLASGTQWVVDLANSVTWTFTGQSSWSMDSAINVGLTQPLLRGAGRKVVLENLTQEERNFLRAVRQMVLFQQGHYTRIVTGQVPTNSGASSGLGIYSLLSEQIQIQNQRRNVVGLEENLMRFIEMFDANQGSSVVQIEETRQSLLNSQSQLLGEINTHQNRIEQYIRSLGLPPDLKVSISDPLLEQFQLTSLELTVLTEDVADILVAIRKRNDPLPEYFQEKTKDIVRRARGEIIVLSQDLDILQRSMPERRRSLKDLEDALAERLEGGERIDPSIYSTDVFEDRITKLRTQHIPQNLSRLQALFTILDLFANTDEQESREMIREGSFDESVQRALRTLDIRALARSISMDMPVPSEMAKETLEPDLSDQSRQEVRRIIVELRRRDDYREWVREVFSVFQNELVLLSLMQTRTRLDSMTLVPVSVTAEEAFLSASEHHLEWMNEKTKLVDAWRQIDIRADSLKGVLDLSLSGTAGRRDTQSGQAGDLSQIQASLQWDSPLNRYAEMMSYRSSQIDYQRARRAYYTYVDTVHANLRNTVRNLQMGKINFEINRNAVLVGAIRVDAMQLQMEQQRQISANAARDLISALDGLLASQNRLLAVWVNYETQRMLLDYGMGTMALDDRGRWIDPGAMGSAAVPVHTSEVVPLPLPLDRIVPPQLNRRYVAE